jgi:hypothetical protein
VLNTRIQYHDKNEAYLLATSVVEQVKELDPENVFQSLLKDKIEVDQQPALLELFREILADQLQADK